MSASTFTVRGSSFTFLVGAAATLLLATACGSTTVPPAAGTSPSGASTPGGVLSLATTSLGPVLVDSKGMTVYLLTADSPGHSSCAAQCLQLWPPVSGPAGSAVPSVPGVGAALAVTKTTSGASMLTAGGWPLYTFAKDMAPGDVNGQGKKSFGGTWYAVSPSGLAVKTTPKSAPTTTSDAKGGYGY